MSEWLKEHAWKVCIRQRIEGSNPSLTAKLKKTDLRVGFLLSWFPGNRTEVINDGSDPIPQNVIVMNNILFVVSQP